MARKAAGMGRGLAAILPDSHEMAEPSYRDVPVELIRPNTGQPRKSFDSDALDRLAESIGESGVVQPLVVQPLSDGRYELIALPLKILGGDGSPVRAVLRGME